MAEKRLTSRVYAHAKWLCISGVLLMLMGVLTLTQFFEPLGLIISSLLLLIHAFVLWWKKWLGFSLHLLSAIFYAALIYVIGNDKLAVLLTAVAIASYATVGVFRIYISLILQSKQKAWDWTLLCGVINIILAVYLILRVSAISHLILAASLDLFFTGWALMALGLYNPGTTR